MHAIVALFIFSIRLHADQAKSDSYRGWGKPYNTAGAIAMVCCIRLHYIYILYAHSSTRILNFTLQKLTIPPETIYAM